MHRIVFAKRRLATVLMSVVALFCGSLLALGKMYVNIFPYMAHVNDPARDL